MLLKARQHFSSVMTTKKAFPVDSKNIPKNQISYFWESSCFKVKVLLFKIKEVFQDSFSRPWSSFMKLNTKLCVLPCGFAGYCLAILSCHRENQIDNPFSWFFLLFMVASCTYYRQ